MSIRTKLTIIFLAIATVPLILVSQLTYHNFKRSLEANRLAQLNDLAAFRADRIEDYFYQLKTSMAVAQGYYNIRKNLPILDRRLGRPEDNETATAKKMLADQLKQMQSVSKMTDIMLVRPDGKVVYANEAGHYRLDFAAGTPFERGAFANGKKKISLSDIYYDSTEDRRFEMLVTAPAVDLNGRPSGVIVFEVDMTTVYRLIQDVTGLGATGEVLVGKKAGNKVEFLNPLRHDPSASLKKKAMIGDAAGYPIQQAVQGKYGSGIAVDYRGEPVIAAWRYVPSMGWGLVAKIDAREAFADVINLRNLVLAILLIVIALCSVMAYAIAHSIATPIARLSKGAAIIGSGKLDHRVGMAGNDEIGLLSRAFDKMTLDLKTTTASRDELNREILQRKAAEEERETAIDFLRFVNNSKGLADLMKSSVRFFQDKSGFEAVGIRLKKGFDYPYFETLGFSEEFVREEKPLCGRDAEGRPLRDAEGQPVMECLCGKVIQNRADPSKVFFTGRGDFWSNGTSEQSSAIADADRQVRIRNRCNGEGYESVGLFALRAGDGTLGLLQLNDRRKGMFTPQKLALWERLSDYLAVAVSKFLALEELRESEERLRFHFENSPLAVVEWDAAFFVTQWSAEAERMFGHKKEEALGRRIDTLNLIFPDDIPFVNKTMERLSGGVERMIVSSNRNVTKTGAVIECVWYNSVLLDDKGNLMSVMSLVQDVTERKRAEEALRVSADDLARSNRDLEQFAYVASHDLQEPLRAVGGFMGLLKNQYKKELDATAGEYIDLAIEGAERMQTLIHDLLAFSRVGTRGAIFKLFAMKDAVDTALKNLQAVTAETDTRILCDDMPEVVADVSQMVQLFQNLIGNAVKFHGTRRPEIGIGAEQRADEWVFSVKDNGIGIEPQYFDRIFLIFQRLHTRSQYKGTGIGLAVCKKIVERHGGRIWVESKPGEGSAFYFTLPYKKEGVTI